jgi:hypothetical protein
MKIIVIVVRGRQRREHLFRRLGHATGRVLGTGEEVDAEMLGDDGS